MALIPVTDVNALTMDDLSLSRLQIIQHQKDLIHDWDPASEVYVTFIFHSVYTSIANDTR